MTKRNAFRPAYAFLAVLLPVTAYGAEVTTISPDNAFEAGRYMGVAEQCFSNIEMVVTVKARNLAKQAKKIHPKAYAKGYNDEMKGPQDFFDESFCYDQTPKFYGKEGSVSRRIGFRIFDTDNIEE